MTHHVSWPKNPDGRHQGSDLPLARTRHKQQHARCEECTFPRKVRVELRHSPRDFGGAACSVEVREALGRASGGAERAVRCCCKRAQAPAPAHPARNVFMPWCRVRRVNAPCTLAAVQVTLRSVASTAIWSRCGLYTLCNTGKTATGEAFGAWRRTHAFHGTAIERGVWTRLLRQSRQAHWPSASHAA
jgi:hypothetical protein